MRRRVLLVIAVLALAALACGGSGGGKSSSPAVCIERTYKGTGDDVVDVADNQEGCSKAKLTHNGQRNFIVRMYRGSTAGVTLANEIGPYEGTAKWDGRTTSLEIDADGAWTIAVMK